MAYDRAGHFSLERRRCVEGGSGSSSVGILGLEMGICPTSPPALVGALELGKGSTAPITAGFVFQSEWVSEEVAAPTLPHAAPGRTA